MNEPIKVAGCIILDDYGRLLLLHHYSEERSRWETPGGKLEEDETIEAAAIREAREETGIVVEPIRRLGKSTIELDKGVYEIHWVKVEIRGGKPEIMEADKFDDLDYFEVEDLPSLALSYGMQDFQAQLLSGEIRL